MQFDQFTDLIWFFLALAVVWLILRFVLRLAWKAFSLGCSLLLALALILFLGRYLMGS